MNRFLQNLCITLLGFIGHFPTSVYAVGSSLLIPGKLRCQGMVTPPLVDDTTPTFDWSLSSADITQRGQMQSGYQILVSDSQDSLANDNGNLWNSGQVKGDRSFGITYAGKPLQAHQTCYWKVRAWNADGSPSAWSDPASWSMGYLPSGTGWKPTWIGNESRTPLLRKEFSVSKPVTKAWVYASALGLYELRMNGKKVGGELFTPGWTDYRKRVQYQRYDVTDLIKSGSNVVGAELAPGWFAGKIGWFNINRYGKTLGFAAELHIGFTDRSTMVVSTDASWKTGAGGLTDSDIQDGDHYDARLAKAGWDASGFNAIGWKAAELMKGDSRNMAARPDQPVGVIREMKALKMTEPKPGVFIYDLGQNITGVVKITARGAKGTTITLRHAERLNADGTLDFTNLKEAKATDTYIMSGDGSETYQPKFTFHGFRWFSVEGLEKAPSLADVTGIVIGTLLPETGELKTSNPDLNHLLYNIRWTAHNSYLSIPMDSSQRSERLGWTGDANVMTATSSWFSDMSRFYTKWEYDILDAQSYNKGATDGGMPNVAPRWMAKEGGTGGGWGDVGVNVPYNLWRRYGDTEIIRDSYVGMTKWISYLERHSKDHIIPVNARVSTAGDWENADDQTPKDLIGTFYYALDVSQVAEMAAAIGKADDAATYRKQFEDVRAAIISHFFATDGKLANGTQTAQVFALHLGLYPDGMKDKVLSKLLDNIKAHQDHLTTGYLGSQWLLKVLTDNGHADVAYKILLQKTGPSWLFMASNGQTTLWEGWNTLTPDGTFGSKRTSLGHSALGSCGDWMFQSIGGLVPDPMSPGFKHFSIHPIPGGGLTRSEMSFQSVHGRIVSNWVLKDGEFSLNLEVPINTTATVILPSSAAAGVTEGGKPIKSSLGVVFEGVKNGSVSYKVGSGNYTFTAPDH